MSNPQLRRTRWLVVAAALALPLAASAAPKAQLSKKDQHFMTEAIQGDLSEIKMGKLAQEKGQTDAVKQFGKTLEQDHSDNLQKAQQLASQNGLTAPTEPNAKQQKMYQKLSSVPANKFDAAFARAMVKDHKKDVGKFRKEAKSNSAAADFAKQTVPVLQKHLQLAESLTSGRASR
ncbi:MAG: DUF4142 domain-containing protein [Gemmatimonas sp.]